MSFIHHVLKFFLVVVHLHDDVLANLSFLQYREIVWNNNLRTDLGVRKVERHRPIALWTVIPRCGESNTVDSEASMVENEAKGQGATAIATPIIEDEEKDKLSHTEDSKALDGQDNESDFNSKVMAAMKKFGVGPSDTSSTNDSNCKNGVCEIPSQPAEDKITSTNIINDETEPMDEKVETATAAELAKEMKISESMAFAALAAAKGNKDMAREIIEYEQSATASILDESPELQALLEKGYNDKELCKRALALTEGNVQDAIAILDAEAADELEEQQNQQIKEEEDGKQNVNEFKTIDVAAPAGFDPAAASGMPAYTGLPPQQQQQSSSPGSGMSPPPPAAKSDVVFQGTGDNLQKIVMESPVPVLLDVYADWCGPCKALTPALEDMAVKGGGMFRLVKLNSDEERAISRLLGVEALPTVFGIRDGQVIGSFKGMPRSEEALKSFMMTLLTGTKSSDSGSISDQEEERKHQEISLKLAKAAGMSALPFAVREQIQNRIYSCLDDLVVECNDDMVAADKSAQVLRQLMSIIIQNPTDPKYRQINLDKPFLAERIGKFDACINVLKYSGFQQVGEGGNKYMFGSSPGKKIINTAPLSFANSAIDKWCDKNQYNIDAAARKQRDEKARAELAVTNANEDDKKDEVEDAPVEDKTDVALLKIRISGKKKVHTIELSHESTLQDVLEELSIEEATEGDDEEGDKSIQITCAAKKLVISSSDGLMMNKSLLDHGLIPKASLVIQLPSASTLVEEGASTISSSKLKERAAKKKKKSGSHTMQSIGIYAKDDNAKGNIVDGGGGTCYEQDVTDDEEEEQPSPEDS